MNARGSRVEPRSTEVGRTRSPATPRLSSPVVYRRARLSRVDVLALEDYVDGPRDVEPEARARSSIALLRRIFSVEEAAEELSSCRPPDATADAPPSAGSWRRRRRHPLADGDRDGARRSPASGSSTGGSPIWPSARATVDGLRFSALGTRPGLRSFCSRAHDPLPSAATSGSRSRTGSWRRRSPPPGVRRRSSASPRALSSSAGRVSRPVPDAVGAGGGGADARPRRGHTPVAGRVEYRLHRVRVEPGPEGPVLQGELVQVRPTPPVSRRVPASAAARAEGLRRAARRRRRPPGPPLPLPVETEQAVPGDPRTASKTARR